MDLGLSGKRALVIGASQGIGRAIAEGLASEGCNVAIASRSAEKLKTVADGIASAGGSASVHTVDLSDISSVSALAESVLAAGPVDILVNNCGGPPPSGALGVAADEWRRQFDAMVISSITLTEAVVPGMRERGWGRIQFILSSGVIQPIPTLGISNVLRSSVASFSKTLAKEVAPPGITSKVLLPGRIETDRLLSLDQKTAEREGMDVADVRKRSQSAVPVGRYGQPREFADVAAFLASERASYVTGMMMRIDGGLINTM
jgi:3-oxoacyl-[acyl-carrier protein] reductase